MSPRKGKTSPAPGAPRLMTDSVAQENLDPTGAKTTVNIKKWRDKTIVSLGSYARTHNIHDEELIKTMIEGILVELEKIGHNGDTDKAFQMIAHEVWKYFNDNPDGARLPKCAKGVATEVEQWLRGHYGLDKNLVQMLMRRSNLGAFDIERVAWLANVHSQAEQMAFNSKKTYQFHWFNGTQATAFLIRFHRACDEREIPYGARSRFVTEAIAKPTIFGFEGTLQDLEVILAPKLSVVPVKTKQSEETPKSVYTESDEDAEDLDKWFPRDKGDKETSESIIDKPSRITRNWDRFWLRVEDLWNLYEVAVEDDMRSVVHEIVGVTSLTEVDDKVNDADLMTTIKAGLDKRYQFREAVIKKEPSMTNLTAEQWGTWREANYPNLSFNEIIPMLNTWQVSQGGEDYAMTRLSQWKGDLREADEAVEYALSFAPTTTTDASETSKASEADADDNAPPETVPMLNMDYTMVTQPIRCAPSARGNFIYKGYRWWIEFGVGGTMYMAKSLMDEILTFKELIDPACIVNPQIPVTDSSKLPNAQPQPVTAANAGIVPTPGADSENCYGIIRTMDVKGEKLVYNLLFKLANGADPQSPIQISTPRAKEMLESTLVAHGLTPEELPMGKRVDMNIYFERVKNGKFWDYIKFVILPESM